MNPTMFDIQYDPVLVKAMIKALGHKYYESDGQRAIIINAFEGAYGIAGYIACVEGTPPLGVFILHTRAGNFMTGIAQSGRTRTATDQTGNENMKWVRGYLITHINTQLKKHGFLGLR